MSDETPRDASVSKTNGLFPVIPPGPERNRKLAYLMLKEGKAFQPAALEAGFPESVAKQGLAYARRAIMGLNEAFAEESKTGLTSEELRIKCENALIRDIEKGKSSGVERGIEVLGKMRVHDWFVRNSETTVGIFVGLSDPPIEVSAIDE